MCLVYIIFCISYIWQWNILSFTLFLNYWNSSYNQNNAFIFACGLRFLVWMYQATTFIIWLHMILKNKSVFITTIFKFHHFILLRSFSTKVTCLESITVLVNMSLYIYLGLGIGNVANSSLQQLTAGNRLPLSWT